MFSKPVELAGVGVIAWGLAALLGYAAALLFVGVALVFIGAMTDDDAVGLVFRRGWGWVRYGWYRQVLRENGVAVPALTSRNTPVGWVVCECGGGNPDCPLCFGSGYVPDPEYQANPRSPHPPIKVDPEAQAHWSRMAKARIERSKLRDRTRALSRYEPSPDDDIERLA